MIVFGPHNILGDWLCQRIEYMPTKNLRCLGNVTSEGKILGVVGFDSWNGASCQIHVAGNGNWVTREFLRCVFDYVFNTAKLKVVVCIIESINKKSLKFTRHVGWKEVTRIVDGHPSGDLIVFEMRPENCKFLEKTNGQSYSRAA